MVNKTFRIFVSSTFSDFSIERNFLQEHVFPRLRKFCESHDCRFQAIDLRWGISQQSAQDQQTMRVCLEEIQRCRAITPKPNFIVLLGDRYGWQPLPDSLPGYIFKHISTFLEGENIFQTLHQWYKEDLNAVPSEYILQPRSNQFEDYQTWYREVEAPLLNAIRKATMNLELPDELRLKLHASAVHQEIFKGVLEKKTDTPFSIDQAFCFFRSIENLPRNEDARKYIDLDVNGNPDNEAVQKLTTLKKELETTLPGNCFYYKSSFTKTGLTYDHLVDLCPDMFVALRDVISKQIAQIQQADTYNREIESHERFARQYAENFVGQREIRKSIIDRFKVGNRAPLVVHGEPGSGKTALMAKLSWELAHAFPHSTVICRFIGATPDSISAYLFLENLVKQLSQRYNTETEIPGIYEDLITVFKDLLRFPDTNNPLILVIDAINQFSGYDVRKNLTWLPSTLPPDVHILLSTISGPYLSNLRKKILGDPIRSLNSFLELQPMNLSDAGTLLDTWLNNERRTLQPQQRQMVLDMFRHSPLPLQLRLAFEQLRNWRSYQNKISLIPNIHGMVEAFIELLSKDSNHGLLLVEKVLSYLTASRQGLTENELLELLNDDPEMKEDIVARFPQSPRLNQIPVVIWSRLYFELKDFLNDNTVRGLFLIRFFHQQMQDIIHTIYLNKPERETAIHLRLADYFHSKGYENGRTLSERVYHLGKVAENTGGTSSDAYNTLKNLFFEAAFLEKKFQHSGQLSSVLADIAIVYEIAAQHGNMDDIIKLGTLNQQWKSKAVDYVKAPPTLSTKGHMDGTADMVHQLVKSETKFVVFLLLCASFLGKDKEKALTFLEEADQVPISTYQSCWDPIMAFLFEGLLQHGHIARIKKILNLRDLEDHDLEPYFTVFTTIKNDHQLAAQYDEILAEYISRIDSEKNYRAKVKLVKYMAKYNYRSRLYDKLKHSWVYKGAAEFEMFAYSELMIIRHLRTIEIIKVKDAGALVNLPLGIEHRVCLSHFLAETGDFDKAIEINRGHIRRNHFVRGLTGILENLPPHPLPGDLAKKIAKDVKRANNCFHFAPMVFKPLWPWLFMVAAYPFSYFILKHFKYFLPPEYINVGTAEVIGKVVVYGTFTFILIYYTVFKLRTLKCFLAPGKQEKTYAVTEQGSYFGHYFIIPFILMLIVVNFVINPLYLSKFSLSQLPVILAAVLVILSFYFYRKLPVKLRFRLAIVDFTKNKIKKLTRRFKWLKKVTKIDFINLFYRFGEIRRDKTWRHQQEIICQILHSTKKLPLKNKIKALFSLDIFSFRNNKNSDFGHTFKALIEFDGSDITGKRKK